MTETVLWTLKMKSLSGVPLTLGYCTAFLSALRPRTESGFFNRELIGGEFVCAFETRNLASPDEVAGILREITRTHPDSVVCATCFAPSWKSSRRLHVSRGETEWLNTEVTFSEPLRIRY